MIEKIPDKIANLSIIKLGGAAITDKNQEYTLRRKILDQAMNEISKSGVFPVIVHGAGSFAHNLASQYHLTHGASSKLTVEKQREGIALTRNSLQQLHKYVLDSAINVNLYPFSIPVSATLISKGADSVDTFYTDSLFSALENNFTPILYGDICFDKISSFRVISGDRIIKLICEIFKNVLAKKTKISVVFGSNVDGFYNKPPTQTESELVEKLNYNDLTQAIENARGSTSVDVTGGMRGKLIEIRKIIDLGIDVKIVNITKPNRLYQVLTHQNTIMTQILPNI